MGIICAKCQTSVKKFIYQGTPVPKSTVTYNLHGRTKIYILNPYMQQMKVTVYILLTLKIIRITMNLRITEAPAEPLPFPSASASKELFLLLQALLLYNSCHVQSMVVNPEPVEMVERDVSESWKLLSNEQYP